MAAPIYQVSPLMGSNIIIVVFAVVVIGGMGSILGAIVAGFALGLVEGLTKVFYPEASNTVIFVIMAIVLLVKPAGLFGAERADVAPTARNWQPARWRAALLALALVAPFFLYPVFLMKALCFALFACAFNLLLGYVGLLSFGHAAFFGSAAYVTGACRQGLGPAAGARHSRRRPRSAALLGAGLRLARDPPPGHLFRDDHPGARADGLFLRAAGALDRGRGRHPGGAARQAASASSTSTTL